MPAFRSLISGISPPPPSASADEKAEVALKLIDHIARAADINIRYGLQRHQKFTSVPTAADIDETQLVLGFDDPNWRLYTQVSGVLKSIVAGLADDDHSADHERAGSDEIDGDHLDIDLTPSNYTPSTTPAEAAHVDDLAAHLAGIDTIIGTLAAGAVADHSALNELDYASAGHTGFADDDHDADHERAGADEVDGDHLGIDLTPSNYTPTTAPAEAAHVDDLAAHLAGIDTALGTIVTDHENLGNLDYASAAHTEFAGTGVANTFTAAQIVDGANFEHQPDVGDVALFGLGQQGQITLEANLDHTGVLIKRWIDGASTYSEAGANLVLQRIITNVTSEDGNFIELQGAAGTPITYFDKSGHLRGANAAGFYITNPTYSSSILLTSTLRLEVSWHGLWISASGIQVRGGDTLFSTWTADFPIEVWPAGADAVTKTLFLHGSDAFGAAVTNQDGGNVVIYAGDHATGGGDEGSLKIANADGSTLIAQFQDSAWGMFGVAPQVQQAHIVDADGTIGDITTKFNTLLADLEGYGQLANA